MSLWYARDAAIYLFEEKDIDDDWINFTLMDLRQFTDIHLAEDCNKVIIIANDIQRNTDTYSQFILQQLIGTGITTDSELISFLPPERSLLEYHLIKPEWLTN